MIGIDQYLVSMFLFSILAGLIGSLVGVGGGILVVPILTILYGVPIPFAIGASIVSVIATSSGSASAYVKDGITNLRIGMFLETATTTGALLGAITTLFLIGSGSEWIVFIAFGVVLVFSAADLFRRTRRIHSSAGVKDGTPSAIGSRLKLKGEYYDSALRETIRYSAVRISSGLGIMFLAGIISGLLGIGSGALKVMGMDSMMKLPFKVSTTTSNFMIGVTAAASTGIFYIGGFVNPILVGPVAIGVVSGSLIGTRVLVRAKPTSLRWLFVVVLVILGAEMIQRGVALL